MTIVADLERASYDTWTSDESTEIAGWTLHAADGFTRRANSATAVGAPDTSAETRSQLAQWLDDRCATLIVRSTPLLSSESIDVIERVWDYRAVEETIVMTATARRTDVPSQVAVDQVDNPTFLDRVHTSNQRTVASRPARRRLLERVADRAAGLTIDDFGVGLVVASGRYAAVYSVAVAPQVRRRGHARALMAAATNWAVDRGCDTMFLQVLGTNREALALYDALGYTEVYRYRYLTPPEEHS